MKKPTITEVLEAILIAAVFALIYYGYTTLVDDCDAKGGVLVRGLGWYECLAVERR